MPIPALVAIGIDLLFGFGQATLEDDKRRRAFKDSFGKLSIPTTDEGGAIPVVFGTVRLNSPFIFYQGDFSHTLKATGWHYYTGMAAGICFGPIDDLQAIYWDDRNMASMTSAAYTKSDQTDYFRVEVNAPHLFQNAVDQNDGDDGAGEFGMEGSTAIAKNVIEVYKGGNTQVKSYHLADRWGGSTSATIPAFPRLCYAVFRNRYYKGSPTDANSTYPAGSVQFYYGADSAVRPFAFVVTRWPNSLGLASNKHKIAAGGSGTAYEANPACVLFEILRDTVFGLRMPSTLVDTTSFTNAGNTLYTENLGISFAIDGQRDAHSVIQDILTHIDGVLRVNPTTGKIELKLIRNDYTVGALPILQASNLESCKMSRGSWDSTINDVRVRYQDRDANYQEAVQMSQDIGNMDVRGGDVAVQEYTAIGAKHQAIAQQISSRMLRTLSYPWAKFELVANRYAWNLRPGDAFILRWPSFSAADIVCRVARISTGTLTDGKITIDAVEDTFGVTASVYSTIASNTTDTEAAPTVPSHQGMIPAPYQKNDPIGENPSIWTVMSSGTVKPLGYESWQDIGGGNYQRQGVAFGCTPVGITDADLLWSDVSTQLLSFHAPSGYPDGFAGLWTDDNYEEFNEGKRMLLVVPVTSGVADWHSAEIISFVKLEVQVAGGLGVIAAGSYWTTYISSRGCLDTTPRTHPSGSYVFALSGYHGALNRGSLALASTSTYTTKLLPFTRRGTLAIGSATAISLAFTGNTNERAQRPWAPTGLSVNGFSFPTLIGANDAVLTWQHRNRYGTSQFYDSNQVSNNFVEPGISYEVECYGSGVLRRTITGITAPTKTATYTLAQNTTDHGGGTTDNVLEFRVYARAASTAGNRRSYQYVYFRVQRT